MRFPVALTEPNSSTSCILDVNEFFNRLVQAKILPSCKEEKMTMAKNDQKSTNLSLNDNIMNQEQRQAIQNMYAGKQCATCDMRFPNDQKKKFSDHYDWHFRQNKRSKEEINKARSRNWFYSVNDWIQYEEISEEVVNTKFQPNIKKAEIPSLINNNTLSNITNVNKKDCNSIRVKNLITASSDVEDVSVLFLFTFMWF